jgi:hypothetical protein
MTEHFVIEITWNDETMHSEEFEVDSLLQIGKKLVAISETLLSSWKEFSEESIDDDIREYTSPMQFGIVLNDEPFCMVECEKVSLGHFAFGVETCCALIKQWIEESIVQGQPAEKMIGETDYEPDFDDIGD